MRNKRNYIIFCIIMLLLNSNVSYAKIVSNQKEYKNILILSSKTLYNQWTNDIIDGINMEFKKLPYPTVMMFEQLNGSINSSQIYHDKMIDSIIEKYKDVDIDLIITIDQLAYEIANNYESFIDDSVPVVFCGVERKLDEQVHKNMTGILEENIIEKNLKLMIELIDNLDKILILSDENYTENYFYQEIINSTKDIQEVEIEYFTSNDEEEVINKINSYDENIAILLLNWSPIQNHKDKSDISSIGRVSSKIKYPIFTENQLYINGGIVGGVTTSGLKHGQVAGEIASRVLNGTNINEIDIIIDEQVSIVFDYNQLKRFNIDEKLLPSGSKIENIPKNTYELPKNNLVISILIAVLVLLIGIILIMINVKKRQEAEVSERINVKRIEEIKTYDKLRIDFFANISHDLKTPINVILSAVQYMELTENKEPENTKKYLNTIKGNSYRLLRLISNLIDLNKLEIGDIELNLKNYEIIGLIEDIVMSILNFVESKNIELVFDTDVEELILCCDIELIERVILNLLSNAVKFTNQEGKIFVNVKKLEQELSISIRDTGIGIPKEKLALIFDRFGQVKDAQYRNKQGSGIGLTLVKNIINKHSGRIDVLSEEGIGSEFIIYLPINVKENEDALHSSEVYTEEHNNSTVELSDI